MNELTAEQAANLFIVFFTLILCGMVFVGLLYYVVRDTVRTRNVFREWDTTAHKHRVVRSNGFKSRAGIR